MTEWLAHRRIWLEAVGVFTGALAILLTLGPNAPFTKELGVCESGAVRDILAGNLILPHFIPGPMVHVPPLYWWVTAIVVQILGWGELAFRLPALVPAAITCAIIYAWTATRLSREAALWGALVLLFGHFFIDAARQPRMDSMLAMFVTAAAFALERTLATRRPAWFVTAALMIGLGSLTKGILGIALPGVAVAFYLLVQGRWAALFRLDLIGTFVAGLAVGLSWYVGGYLIAGSKFLQWQIGMNLWSRFIPAEAGGANYCVHPFWYFVPQILVGLLPWSLFLPALAFAMWPRNREALSEAVVYTSVWFVAILLFFSLSRGKCQVYILPALPPLAILIGWAIARSCAEFPQPAGLRRLFSAGAIATALGAALLACGAIALIRYGLPARLPIELHPTDRRLIDIFQGLAATRHYGILNWIVVSLIGSFVIFRGVWKQFPAFQAFGVLIVAVAGSRFWFGVMNPALADHETLALFTSEALDVVPRDAAIGHIGIEDCGIYFYSPRPIEPIFHFRCDAQPPLPPYLIIRKRRFDSMPADQRACLTPILISEAVDGQGPRLLVQQTSSPKRGAPKN